MLVGTVAAVTVARDDPPEADPPSPTPRSPESPDSPESPESPTEEPGPTVLLLPDVLSVRATGFEVEQVPDGRRLRFAAWLGNAGPGPLLVRPRQPGPRCPEGRHPAVQVIHRDARDDGGYRPRQDRPLRTRHAGCMVRHPGHDHWHFDAMASYELRDPATDEVVAARRKVSFCLRDNRRLHRVPTRVRREHFGECERTGPQGISPGWIDIYDADLPGQSLRLPSAPRRLYCLDLTADPRERLVESDEDNNAWSTGVLVDGTTVTPRPGADC